MRALGTVIVSLCVASVQAHEGKGLKADSAKKCESCEAWNVAQEPFRIFGNTYYVGVVEATRPRPRSGSTSASLRERVAPAEGRRD